MLVPSVVEVPIFLPKREMNRNQWFRPINAESPFELDRVGKGPRVIDDTSGSSSRSPRTSATTPVDLDDNMDGDSLFNEHSEFLSSIIDRSEVSLDNSSISTRTTTTLPRDYSTMTFPFNQERKESAKRSTTRQSQRLIPMAPIIIQDASTIEAAPPPRRPRSAYIHFLKSVRDKNLAAVKTRRERLMNMEILLDTVEARWNALSPQQKEVFERQAAEDNDRYQRELQEYERFQSQNIIPKAPEENGFYSQSRKRERFNPNADEAGGSQSSSNDFARKRISPSTRPPLHTNPAYILGEIAPPFQAMHRRPLPPPQYLASSKEPSLQENLPLIEGTEVELTVSHQKRKFRVHYECISMTKAQAEDYVRNLSRGRLSLTPLPLLDRENTKVHA